jgi:hypothetical protein
MLHPGAITPPSALRGVFVNVFNDTCDAMSLDAASLGGEGKPDAVLSFYLENWWTPPDTPKKLDIIQLFSIWTDQRPMITRPIPRAPTTTTMLGDLTLEALHDARTCTSQALETVDRSLEINEMSLKRVKATLTKHRLVLRNNAEKIKADHR